MDKRQLFATKLSFEEFNLICFLHGGLERLACFEPQRGSKVFLKKLKVHSVLYGHRRYVFKREFLCLERFHGRFHILTSVWMKDHKMCIWNWFFAMRPADLTCLNGSRIQLVLHANCFLGLTCGFLILNKKFQEIKLLICHCSFVNISSKHDRETADLKIFGKTLDGLLSILELRLIKCFFCLCSIELLFIFLFITRHSIFLQRAALFP